MIIPSIDLSNGKVVQLQQGKTKIIELSNPLKLAEQFSKFGEIAVIDIDAAKNEGSNKQIMKQLCTFYDCRVGGGIRTIEQAEEYLNFGANKIIIGTAAFTKNGIDEEFLQTLSNKVGKEKIIIALDNNNGEVVLEGWKTNSGISFESVATKLEKYADEILFTCVEKEGMLKGTNLAAVEKMSQISNIHVTVAGGINSLQEIEKISALNMSVQLGMAIYTNLISIEDSFIASLNFKNPLIPTIVQNIDGQILMLAYSSRESLKKMFESNLGTYYSRSRKQLWTKGETSGNYQQFVKIRKDCDGDALLLTVEQKGFACHTGSYSCFGSEKFNLDKLYKIVTNRLNEGDPKSYTVSLNKKLLAEKIMEEAQEVIEAETRDEIVWEAGDVLYFLTVLLAKNNISPQEVYKELSRRHRVKNKTYNK